MESDRIVILDMDEVPHNYKMSRSNWHEYIKWLNSPFKKSVTLNLKNDE